MRAVRIITETLARTTSRRGLFGRGAQIATGVLMGAAAGSVLRPEPALGGPGTVCAFPGPPCNCDQCSEGGVCSKPCVIYPYWYASGCWVTGGTTCCDCDCQGNGDPVRHVCGCGSDYHNNPVNCPPA
jgi:hypothetical protein